MNELKTKINFSNTQLALVLLCLIGISIIFRIFVFPNELPLPQDAEVYFWYANDMSILGKIPTEYNAHNNFWSSILSIFFSINQTNEILDYMNLQRVLSVIISTLTIFPVFFFLISAQL